MRYLKAKISITTAVILIAGITITSMPRVNAQREKHQSVDEQKLLAVAAQRDGSDDRVGSAVESVCRPDR